MSGQLSIIDADGFKFMEDVAELHVKGLSPYTIARRLGAKAPEVKSAIAQWQEVVSKDSTARDAARDHLNKMVIHYDSLIAKAHANLEDLDALIFDEKVSAQKNATLKNIADFESKRVDALQKAGVLDATDLGDELAEREKREEMLIKILRDDLCNDCRMKVASKLQEITQVVEATVVYDE